MKTTCRAGRQSFVLKLIGYDVALNTFAYVPDNQLIDQGLNELVEGNRGGRHLLPQWSKSLNQSTKHRKEPFKEII
jgi:hypothetical protein